MRSLIYLFLISGLIANATAGNLPNSAISIGSATAIVSETGSLSHALWNPATISTIDEINFYYDLSQGGFAIGVPIRKVGTIAFTLFDLNGEDRFLIDKPQNPIGTFEYGDNRAVIAFGRSIGTGFHFGTNVNLTTRVDQKKWEPSYDFGFAVSATDNFDLGLAIREIGETETDPILDLGATWHISRFLKLKTALDATSWQLRFGGEIETKWIDLRTGLISFLDASERSPIWTGGISAKLGNTELAYAFINDPKIENRHLLSFSVKFGRLKREKIIEPPKPKVVEKTETKPKKYQKTVEQIAKRYNVETALILAMIMTESTFRPDAVSRSGAVGLGQLMPPTAKDLGLKVPNYRNRLKPNRDAKIDERFDPKKNLPASVSYLRKMLDRYDNNYVLALAAYNAGPGRVKKDVPLIRETEKHVGKVLNYYYRYKSNPDLLKKDLAKLNQILGN